MSTINNGGTAFPAIKIVAGDNYNPPKQYHMPGMSLRDYFAAKAMQGVIASCVQGEGVTPSMCAPWCYEMADAMLKAREQKGP